MKNRFDTKSTKQWLWNTLKTGVFVAIPILFLASVEMFAQEAPQKPGVSPEQQQRLDAMKAKGTEASLTVLPVRIGGKCWDRLTEVVGVFFEQQGMKIIELGKTEFTPGDKSDPGRLRTSVGEFVRQNPITTDYALYAEYVGSGPGKLDELRAAVVDKTGDVVWTERQTSQDAAFKRHKANDAMTMSVLLIDRLGPKFGLNDQTRKAAKPGRLAALLAERSGLPPENERTPMAGRQAEMKKAGPNATLIVFSPRVRATDQATVAGEAADLARLIGDAGLCQTRAARRTLLLKASQEDPNEAKVMWDLAREFRDVVKKIPVDADYILYADYRFNPQHWEQGYVHVIVCDRQGEWVIAELRNSHHPDYQGVKPTSKEDCDKILVKVLARCLK